MSYLFKHALQPALRAAVPPMRAYTSSAGKRVASATHTAVHQVLTMWIRAAAHVATDAALLKALQDLQQQRASARTARRQTETAKLRAGVANVLSPLRSRSPGARTLQASHSSRLEVDPPSYSSSGLVPDMSSSTTELPVPQTAREMEARTRRRHAVVYEASAAHATASSDEAEGTADSRSLLIMTSQQSSTQDMDDEDGVAAAAAAAAVELQDSLESKHDDDSDDSSIEPDWQQVDSDDDAIDAFDSPDTQGMRQRSTRNRHTIMGIPGERR